MPVGYQSVTQFVKGLNDGRDRHTMFQILKNLLSVRADQAPTPQLILRPHRLITSEGVPTSDATAGALTITAAMIVTGLLVRDCAGASRTDTFDTAAAIVASLPDAQVGDRINFRITNGSDAAETITLAAGTGGGFDTNQTAASRVIPQNSSKVLIIRLTNVTAGAEAYVLYV